MTKTTKIKKYRREGLICCSPALILIILNTKVVQYVIQTELNGEKKVERRDVGI